MTLRGASGQESGMLGVAGFGVLALALVPAAGLALAGVDGQLPSLTSNSEFSAITPATVDPRMARFVAERSRADARLQRFTPAGVAQRPGRSVTVAVRVGDEIVRAMSVRSAIASVKSGAGGMTSPSISPMRYNLGLSRGYQSFAKAPELSRSLSDAGIPDLSEFEPTPGAQGKPSRFAARIALAEEVDVGAAPLSIGAEGEQLVDVKGSYRVAPNLDVTAGLRYSQERDPLMPLADSSTQDSQAVYIGTQFRF